MDELLNTYLSAAERAFLARADEVCRESIVPVRGALDESSEFPDHVFNHLRAAGLFNAMFPTEYGGLGLHPLLPILLAEVIGRYCLAVGTIFGVSTFLMPLPLLLFGTEEQKRRYLPKLASGEWLGAFAMTEPDAGSDITNLTTVATRQGRDYVLNGTKKWITNAGRANVYCILARTDTSKDPRVGMSCFIVEQHTPGLSFGPLENKLGLRCVPNRPIMLKDVIVPAENLIGLQPNKGFHQAFQSLTRSRVMVAALGVGLATGAYQEAVKYTQQRKQFGKRINEFQVVQHMLADMLVQIEAARALTYKAGVYAVVHEHREASKYAAMAKYQASEMAMRVVTDALQLHGGNGFVKDSPVEKMFRDAKVLSIYEGTSQLLKNQIATTILMDASRLRSERPTNRVPPAAANVEQPAAAFKMGRQPDGVEYEQHN
jgi:acyl-CoA dehydrogenase